jgi:hypothetical protein
MILIAAFQCDLQHRGAANAKVQRRTLEAQAVHVRFRRFAGHSAEQLVEMIFG